MSSSIGNTDEYVSGAIAPAALRLLLPRRYCEHSSIILASCESNSLLVFSTHTFSARTRLSLSATLYVFLVSLSFALLKTSEKANLQRVWNQFIRRLPPSEVLPPKTGSTSSSLLSSSQRLTPSRRFSSADLETVSPAFTLQLVSRSRV